MLDSTFGYLTNRVPGARSLCDIGCGNGRLLYLAQASGWKVFGLELTEEVASRTGTHLGFEVVVANFLEYEPKPKLADAYDVLCLRHVLEHLPDSKLAMQKILSLLKPSGHALLEFPNVEALNKRVKRRIVNAGLHRRRFRDGFVPGHCNEFCRESFEYLLGESGFRLIEWETYSKTPVANWIYNRLPVGDKVRTLIQKRA
jgi:SAM-dependent methyltransferase